MGPETYYELSKRSIVISKNEETTLTWDNTYLTVRTDKGIQFISFSYDLECLDKVIECLETTLITPRDCPDPELFKAKFLNHEMKNADMSELILDSALWPHNQQLTQEMTLVNEFLWSPKGFLYNEGILAVLNNIGSVEFFVMEDHKWVALLKLSAFVKQYLDYNKSPKTFRDLRNSVYVVCTWTMCWSPNINSDKSCYFATAQMDGTILFWSIEHNINTCIKGKFKSECGSEITNMIWIPKTDGEFLLVCANVLGQVLVYVCRIENDEINLHQCYTLWSYKDRMIARNMKYTIINNQLIFTCSKHRHVLVQVLDDDCKVISQCFNNLNDHRITCITNSAEGLYVATVNCKLFKMNVSLSINNVLNVDLVPIEIKESYSTHELYSICFTPNNIILALGMIDRRVLCRKEGLTLDIMFLSTDKKLETLLPNLLFAKSLANHWDCIEVLRYKMVRQKKIPDIEHNHLSIRNSKHILKISLIIAIVYNKLKKAKKIGSEVEVPCASVETIREEILLITAISLMQQLHDKYQSEGMLSSIDHESLGGAKKYLKYYCEKYDKDASEFIEKSILDIPHLKYEYECQCCDENIEGFSCIKGHLNMFCSQTFTPITSNDYLACKCCGYTVRPELSVQNPLCVFCDLHLINSLTPSE